MTDETRPTTPLQRQVYDSDGDPMTWMDHDIAMPGTPQFSGRQLDFTEPPPDMSDFTMIEIREGAPRRALRLESPGEGLEAWQEDARPKSSRAEVMCVVLVLVLFVMEVAQMLWLFAVVGDGW